MSDQDHETKAGDGAEGRAAPRVQEGKFPVLPALAAVVLIMLGVGAVVANLRTSARDGRDLLSANLEPPEPQKAVRSALNTGKATLRLAAESIRAVLHQVDPTRFVAPELPFKVGFSPNQTGDGGKLTIDLGEQGLQIDYVTISGKVTTDFTVGLDEATKSVLVTIQMSFGEARVHVAEDPNASFSGTLTLNGSVTATTTIKGTTATCVLTGPLEVRVDDTKTTIYTGGVTGVLDGLQRTVVFNGSSRITVEQVGAGTGLSQWRVTFFDLLCRLNTASIDSGRFKVERLATVIPWTIVYRFLFPNGGEKTIYPGELTSPFELGPPEEAPPQPPADLTARGASGTQVDLTWSNGAGIVRELRVERRVAQPTAWDSGTVWAELKEVPAGATSASDTTTVASTAYEYRVIAGNHKGDSGPSNTAVGIALPAPLTLQGLAPAHGRVGDEVVITAGNVAAGPKRVYFKSAIDYPRQATIKSETVSPSGAVTIVVDVPLGARTGPVIVSSGGQSASAAFTVD